MSCKWRQGHSPAVHGVRTTLRGSGTAAWTSCARLCPQGRALVLTCEQRFERCGVLRAAAAPAALPTPIPVPPTTWIVAIGIAIVCLAGTVFLINAAILLRVRSLLGVHTDGTHGRGTISCARLMHTLRKVDEVLDTTADEMPGMAASVRLTGLELSDCILEFSQLSKEVTGGIKSTAQAVQRAEQTARDGGQMLGKVMKEKVGPGFKKRVKASAEIMEFALKRNAGLGYSAEPTVAQMAAAAKVSVSQVRMLLAALAALSQVVTQGAALLAENQEAGQNKEARPQYGEPSPPQYAAETGDGSDY